MDDTANIKVLIKNKRKIFLFFLIFFFLSVLMLFFAFKEKDLRGSAGDKDNIILKKENNTPSSKKKGGSGIKDPLNGRIIKNDGNSNTPVAIMIDNHKNARPAYGIDKADIVFEAEVEGSITRYLAIFNDYKEVEKIGPVRSARPYFINWASGVSALFVHCGGSPQALATIARSGIKNLDEFYKTSRFWRDKTLPRPHNIFTSGKELNDLLENDPSYANEENNIDPWEFKEKDRASDEDVEHEEISIEYGPSYNVKWEYGEENKYSKYLDNHLHKTGGGNIIKASNVIIQVNQAEIQDEKLRLKMDTLGKGKAFICSRGICQEGEWRKESPSDRVKYYKKNNEPAILSPGSTWVQIIDSVEKINIKNYGKHE